MRKLTYSDVTYKSTGTTVTSPGGLDIPLEDFYRKLNQTYFMFFDEKKRYTDAVYNLIKYFQDMDVEITIGLNLITVAFKKYVKSWIPFCKTLETVKYLEISYESVSYAGNFETDRRFPEHPWEINFNRKGKKDFYARRVAEILKRGELDIKSDFERLSSKEKDMIRDVAENIKKVYRSNSIGFITEPYDSVKSFKEFSLSSS